MPTPTYVAIAKNVLSSNQSSVVFSSIPSTYTDLILVGSLRGSNASTIAGTQIAFNGTTTGSYTYLLGQGSPGAVQSGRASALAYIFLGYATAGNNTANTFASWELYIPNYAGSTNKAMSSILAHEDNNTTAYLNTYAGLQSQTNAISEITISMQSGNNIVSGSRFDLYGIKNS
jgi:hypothetical protein